MGSVHEERQQQQQKPNIAVGKKKKSKGTKITVGKNIGNNSTNEDQGVKNSENGGRNKPPWRPTEGATRLPVNDQNSRISKKKKNVNKNTNTNMHHTNNSTNGNTNRWKGNNNVLAKIQAHTDADAIRAALTSEELPSKLKFALGAASLELNNRREFVIQQKEAGVVNHNYTNVRRILQKNAIPGWLEWLQGRRGWTIAITDKVPFLNFHRDLHEAYSISMRALLKTKPNLKNRLVVLYYKQDPETQENGGPLNGTRQNTQTLWKKVSKQESLQDAVGKIRPFLEVLRYFCTDPKERWTSLPWLMPMISQKECTDRLNRISRLVSTLMRSSDWGPDVPVHWAAHPPLNHYPRSTITFETMSELVVGVANILSNLFLQYPISVNTLDQVDKLLPKFSAWMESSSGGTANTTASTATAKKTVPKGSTKKKTAVSHHPRPPTVDPVEPLVIDLTGLSISD